MWQQHNMAAAQYAGGHMGGAGRYQAEAQQQAPWSRQPNYDAGNSRKRQRRTFPEQRDRCEEEEGYLEDSYAQDDGWDSSRRYGEPEERFVAPAPKRMLPRPKPKPPPPAPALADEEQDDDADLLEPMLAMKMEVVEVPKKFIAKIIGKKGMQIRMIRDETGAHIDARDQSQDPCQVKVLGSPDAIEAARKKIAEIIEQSQHKPGIVLEIPRAKIGKVIGIRGAQIHEIQTTTGAKVDVDKDVDPCKVTIGGNDVQIAMAEKVILTLAMEAADMESEYLDLPSAVSGAVLGVKGARLMELQASSGARIDVDKTRPGNCRVRIAGTPDQRELAKQLVLMATEAPRPPEASILGAEGVDSQSSDAGNVAMDLPPGTAGKIIGKNGATLQRIQSESGARVWVDFEAGQARISGQPGAVEHAKGLLQALVEEVGTGVAAGAAASGSLDAGGGVVPALSAPAAQSAWESFGSWSEGAEASTGLDAASAGEGAGWGGDAWGAEQGGAAAQGDTWVGSWQEEAVKEEEGQEDAWEWTGQAPAPETKEEPVEDEELPPTVQPQTAMQRAFAMLAARNSRQ